MTCLSQAVSFNVEGMDASPRSPFADLLTFDLEARPAPVTSAPPPDEFTARDREDAAHLCDALAADVSSFADDATDALLEGAITLGASAEAVGLARAALYAVPASEPGRDRAGFDVEVPLTASEVWAECSAWIRSGWSPGDEFDTAE